MDMVYNININYTINIPYQDYMRNPYIKGIRYICIRFICIICDGYVCVMNYINVLYVKMGHAWPSAMAARTF